MITLSGETGGPRPWEQADLGGASTYFIQTFKKRVFQLKFEPKYA